MKKFTIFMIIVVGIWIYNNPIGKIGMAKPNFIVFSGMPSSIPILIHYKAVFPSYQDKIIVDNEQLKLTDAVKELLSDRLNTVGGFDYAVIGLGYGTNLYTIREDLQARISGYNVITGSTPEMIIKYNQLKSEGKKVFGIMIPSVKVQKLHF